MSDEKCDFVVDVAARLPMAFICEIMGIPRKDWADMFKWGNMVVGFEDAEYQAASGSPLETQQQGGMNVRMYCARLALERRGGTGEDLLTVLGNAELNGKKLTELQLMHNGFLYIMAGLETTRNAISGGLLALIQHPGECARLITDPTLMPTAIEEILRWSSPITHIARTATRDTELAGIAASVISARDRRRGMNAPRCLFSVCALLCKPTEFPPATRPAPRSRIFPGEFAAGDHYSARRCRISACSRLGRLSKPRRVSRF